MWLRLIRNSSLRPRAAQRVSDLGAAIHHLPNRSGWLAVGVVLAWAIPALVGIGLAGGLIRVGTVPDPAQFLRLAAILIVVPSFGEELLFRALLIPRTGAGAGSILLSTSLFVLWHPLQALTIGPPWSSAFLDPWFLAAVGVLGLALGRLYVASGSIWPCVLLHWVVVLTWKSVLGGPF